MRPERTLMPEMDEFEQHRNLVYSIAYRMLGSVADAEDIVQETFLRFQRLHDQPVRSIKALLTTMVTRLCIDHLRSSRVQREKYVGPWLPEPLVQSSDGRADETAKLAESLSMAFLVLLENLSPIQRAVFLLREVFDFDYDEIGRIVDKSEQNCRQIARRAKQSLVNEQPRFSATTQEQEKLADRFQAACHSGDLQGLIELLSDDVVLYADGGGKVVSARRPIYGASNVARFLIGILKKAPPGLKWESGWINQRPGFLASVDQQLIAALSIEVDQEQACRIFIVNNPEKLRHLLDSPFD